MKGCILVTGGAGYIGSHVTLALLDAGYGVVVADNLSTGCRELVPPAASFVFADIGDSQRMRQIMRNHKCNAVMHFAGSTVVPDSVRDPLAYYRNNTCSSRNLIQATVAAGIDKFIFSSTAAVYGNPERLPVTEDDPAEPVSPYGRSKLMIEWMLRDAGHAYGLRSVCLRYFNVAGADPQGRSGQSTPNATHLIKVACEVACGRRHAMTIFGTDYPTPDGTCLRDFIHVSDLANAHVEALRHLDAGGEAQVLNCGYGWGISVKEVVETVESLINRPLPIELGPRRDGDIISMVAAGERIRGLLGWKPRHADLTSIIRSALEWERRSLRNSFGRRLIPPCRPAAIDEPPRHHVIG
ncbi:MAG: UDP-glucose 4-epimerase GalE [Rhodospirillales bacterium]|nr:UDP-glucose 4-epimerase GalE [Rhodospirillales bacterium]